MPHCQRLYAPGRKLGSQNWPKLIKKVFFFGQYFMDFYSKMQEMKGSDTG